MYFPQNKNNWPSTLFVYSNKRYFLPLFDQISKKEKKNLHINVEQKALNHISSHGPLLNAKNQNLKFKMCPAQLLKKHLFKKISLPSNSVFNMHNLIGLEFITKLRLILTLIVKVI